MHPQKLEIIFSLGMAPDAQALATPRGTVSLRMPADPVGAHAVFPALAGVMDELGLPTTFTRSGRKITPDSLSIDVGDRQLSAGSFEAAGLSFRLGHAAACRLSFLAITEQDAGAARCWDTWIRPFLDFEQFVQAWTADSEYEYWQTAHDLLQYKAAGRPFEHLPLRSNGLPFPLEQMIVDTSGNPGRRVLKNGHVEAIGTDMWLGPRFWEATGTDRRSALAAAAGLHYRELDKAIVKLGACQAFDASNQPEQARLRHLLFAPSASDVGLDQK